MSVEREDEDEEETGKAGKRERESDWGNVMCLFANSQQLQNAFFVAPYYYKTNFHLFTDKYSYCITYIFFLIYI